MKVGAMASRGNDDATDFQLEPLAAQQQFAIWHDLVQPLFRPSLDMEAAASFRAEAKAAPIADALLVQTSPCAQFLDRTMDDVRSVGWHHIVVQHYVRGGFEGLCGDQTVAVEAGDINILNLNSTLRTRATDFANLTLVLPGTGSRSLVRMTSTAGRSVAREL